MTDRPTFTTYRDSHGAVGAQCPHCPRWFTSYPDERSLARAINTHITRTHRQEP